MQLSSLSLFFIAAQFIPNVMAKSLFHIKIPDKPKVLEAQKNSYIITFEDDIRFLRRSQEARTKVIQEKAEIITKRVHGQLKHVYSRAIHGFAAQLSESALQNVLNDPMVKSVEEDGVIQINEVGSWGLDRIDDEDLPLDNSYNPTFGNNGLGVTAYVIDTGILDTHEEFEGRAEQAYNSVSGDPNIDCNGHGTHVAGTIGSKTYGVAKKSKLVGVKVLNCSGSGSYAEVIAGIEWVIENAVKPATANMSLGGYFSSTINTAVQNLVNSGVPTVVAAGNSNEDACRSSPASEPLAITVGSTTKTDVRSSFSNWGTCVDIFAPGSDITSPWIGSNTDIRTISGTSMASPHVCGGVVLYLGKDPTLTPAEVLDLLLTDSISDTIAGVGNGSPNKFLYVASSSEHPSMSPTRSFQPSVSVMPSANPSQSMLPSLLPSVLPSVTPSESKLPSQMPSELPSVRPSESMLPSVSCTSFHLKIKTDFDPWETSWRIADINNNTMHSGGSYANPSTLYTEDLCIFTEKCYVFTIFDSWGDGICCENGKGYYEVYYNNELISKGGDYNRSESSFPFGNVCPSASPTTSSVPSLQPSDLPSSSPSASFAPSKIPSSIPSFLPSVTPKYPPLQFIGEDPDTSIHKLKLCQGDCDSDSDCDKDRKCFHRKSGDVGPPGCTGTPLSYWDYCYDQRISWPPSNKPTTGPPSNKPTYVPSLSPKPSISSIPSSSPSTSFTPSKIPSNIPSFLPSLSSKPTSAYPPLQNIGEDPDTSVNKLKLCQGDCDYDSDCDQGLKCFYRNYGDRGPPGCTGTPYSWWDYCYDQDISWPPTSKPTPVPPTVPPTAPSESFTPSASFTPSMSSKPTPKYPPLQNIGEDPDTSVNKLKLCQGDCDYDSNCDRGLKCFQRDSGDGGPLGCTGTPYSYWDYCVLLHGSLEPTPVPSFEPTPKYPPLQNIGEDPDTSVNKLKLCQGDCDIDSHCDKGLKCFHRDFDDGGPPGCTGTPYSYWDYCVLLWSSEPTPVPTPVPSPSPSGNSTTPKYPPLQHIGDDPDTSVNKLKLCQGDCDSDSNCDKGLKCFHRNSGDESPPGCTGTPYSHWDYCYDQRTVLQPSKAPSFTNSNKSPSSPTASAPTNNTPTLVASIAILLGSIGVTILLTWWAAYCFYTRKRKLAKLKPSNHEHLEEKPTRILIGQWKKVSHEEQK